MAEPPSHIGWIRAILTAAAIAVVGTAILVYGTNAVLTKVHGLNRHTRIGLATALFFIALFAIAWVLRWFQRRHAI